MYADEWSPIIAYLFSLYTDYVRFVDFNCLVSFICVSKIINSGSIFVIESEFIITISDFIVILVIAIVWFDGSTAVISSKR